MTAYRTLWLGVWGTVTAIGVSAAFLVWPPGAMLLLFVVSAAATGLPLAVLRRRVGGVSTVDGDTIDFAETLAPSAVGGLVVVAVVGASSVIGPLTWPLLLLGAASSPPAIDIYRLRLAPESAPPAPDSDQPTMPESIEPDPAPAESLDVSQLTATELCHAWRASYTALQSARTTPSRLRLIALRQAYLDEIERRTPDGFTAWLTSGARAAGNPRKYLTPDNNDRGPD